MSSIKDDEEKKVLPVVLIPNTAVFRQYGGQLMVAMQPGVELPAVDVQEVVVVTEEGRRCYTDDDRYGGYDDNEVHVDYDVRSETVAGEIEVADVRGIEDFLVNGRSKNEHRVRHKARKTRYKRHFIKKFPAKPIKKQRVNLPEFDDSESDVGDYMYGGSPRKPRKRDFAHRLQWSDDSMKAAMKAVEDKEKTIRGAAKEFNVPYSTLKDRVRGRVRHGTKPGVKTVLSPEEEQELVKYIKQMEAGGFQLHCINIRERAGELLSLNRGYNTPYQGSIPGHNWLAGFLKRHEGIEMKRSVNRLVAPSTAKQKQMLKRFYETASNAYKELSANVRDKKGIGQGNQGIVQGNQGIVQGNQIYTMTELQFSAFPNTSMIVVASASGFILPPFVLFCGSRSLVPRLQELFPSAYFSASSSHRIKEDVLLTWFREHFLKRVQTNFRKRPAVLFVSQPINNISVRLMQLATDNHVSLVCIPSGISHLVQPMNDIVLREIDEVVGKRGRKWLEERKQTAVDRFGMAEILQKVWQKGLPSDEVVANFEENGLFPLNVRAVSTERIMSSTPSTDALKPSSSDTETNGLTLLSELSSAEYASMEHLGDHSAEGPGKNTDLKRKRVASDEHLFDYSPIKRRHRNAAENTQFGHENVNRSRLADQEIHNILGPKVSQELMKHVLHTDDSEASCSRTRPVPRIADRRHVDIHQEILASRNNHEQLKQAINSITEENSKTAFSVDRHSPVFVPPRQRALRVFSGYGASPSPVKRNRSKACVPNTPSNIDVLTTDGNMSKFVTLKPVRHVVQVSPNVKQEYISYVEDETQRILEEFVPQEMVEEQTIIQDCMTYDVSSEPFCKEEIIEGVVEEVIDLPDLNLISEEVVDESEVKLENIETEYMNNNELTYNLQSGASGADGDGFEIDPTPEAQLKTIKISDLKSRFDLNQKVKIIKLQTVNGQTVQIIETLSMQEFISRNGGNTLSSILRTSDTNSKMEALDQTVSVTDDNQENVQ